MCYRNSWLCINNLVTEHSWVMSSESSPLKLSSYLHSHLQGTIPKMSTCENVLQLHPHVALLPNAGMGHLTPFLRLATQLVHHHCHVTLITTHPTVSFAESRLITRFLSTFPQVTQVQFHLLPLDLTTANTTDPFFLRFETIRRSAHLLSPLLASLSPPLHALVYDVSLISSTVIETLHLPGYMLSTSSAMMFSFILYFPIIASKASDDGDVVEIPGLPCSINTQIFNPSFSSYPK